MWLLAHLAQIYFEPLKFTLGDLCALNFNVFGRLFSLTKKKEKSKVSDLKYWFCD
jgi:hypothetical protein